MQCKPTDVKDIKVFATAPTNAVTVQIVIPPRTTGGPWQNSDENRARRPKRVRFADESSGRTTKELLCVAVPLKKRSKGRAAVEIAAVAIPWKKTTKGSWRMFGDYAVLEPRVRIPEQGPNVAAATVEIAAVAIPRAKRPMGSWRHFGDYAVLEPRAPIVTAVVPAVISVAEDTLNDDEDVEPLPNDEVPNPSEDSADKETVLEPPPNDEAPITFGDSADVEAVLELPPNDEVSTASDDRADIEPAPKRAKGGRRPKKRSRRPIITTGRSCAQVLKEAEAKARRDGPPPIDPTWGIIPDPVAARNAAAERPQNRATEADLRGIDEFLDADRQEKLPAFKKTPEWKLHVEKKAAAAAAEAKAAAEKEAAREKERSAYIWRRASRIFKEKKERLSRLGKQALNVFLAWRRKQS
jgi:hypothetical protein